MCVFLCPDLGSERKTSMNQKEFKRRMAYEVLIILGVLALLTFICRLWPILLLIILGIFIAAIRLLFLSSKKVEVIEPMPQAPEPVKEPTERDVRELAYAVILKRITELITDEYPDARWVWENPNAKKCIQDGEEVYVLLNRAGGYRRAKVVIANLQVLGIKYCSAEEEDPPEIQEPDTEEPEETDVSENSEDSEPEEERPINYELLAYEWTEAHIVELNARCNEAIAEEKESVLLTAEELPVKESWPDICNELIRAGLENAVCQDTGIHINLTH